MITKGLPCKPQDQSSSPNTHVKTKVGMVTCAHNHSVWEAERDRQDPGSATLAYSGSSRLVRDPASKHKMDVTCLVSRLLLW